MMKKIRSFFYLLGQGFIGVFRNSIMTTASVLVLVCCMLVMGTFGLVVKVIEKNFEQVDDLNVIVAYLDKELDDTAISSLQTQIENMRNVTEVRFVSVVLPAPDLPIMNTNSPSLMFSVTLFSAAVPFGYTIETFWKEIIF